MNITSKFKNPSSYIWGTIIFGLFALLAFTWQIWSSLSLSKPIDPSVWGQFGDFVGGILGVIFSLISVLLVLRTFKIQQDSSYEQRFNDLFFELLNLYQEQERELQCCGECLLDGIRTSGLATYKDFFDQIKRQLFNKFETSTSFSKNRKAAIALYVDIVVPYASKLTLCFKTAYRILDLIDKSPLSDQARNEYVKVFRSQLTDSELLCFRYHIKFGDYRRFAYLVNKYNIMKHLPIFEMLEFSYWANKSELKPIERLEIGNFFIMVFKMAKRGGNQTIRRCGGKFVINISVSRSMLSVECVREELSPTNMDHLSGIYKFSNEDLEHLLQCVLREIVVFSNFSMYNNFKNLIFESEISKDGKTVCAIAETRDKCPLILSFRDSMVEINQIGKLF